MSLPIEPGTGLATPPRHVGRSGSLMLGRDRLRAREYQRRRAIGESDLEAWRAVVTDERIGLKRWRGKDSVPVAVVERTLANFLARCAPAECAEAVTAVRQRAAKFAPEAWGAVERIVRGAHDADPAAGKLRLDGAKLALSVVGVATSTQPTAATTNVAIGNVEGSLTIGDFLRREPT